MQTWWCLFPLLEQFCLQMPSKVDKWGAVWKKRERWYVKPGTLGSIPGWGSQITFLNSSDSISFELMSSCILIHFILTDISRNPCWPNPCQHRGVCLRFRNSFACRCRTGWAGCRCEIKSEYILPRFRML